MVKGYGIKQLGFNTSGEYMEFWVVGICALALQVDLFLVPEAGIFTSVVPSPHASVS